MSDEAFTCSVLHAGVKRLFPAPGFIVMQEVRNATGFDSNRSADCLALGMYKSRGRELWGFEMKVSRSDWVKELEQPAKAESWLRYCDRWALVIADEKMVHPGELPEPWGLYAPVKGKLKCIKPCPKLDPDPLNRIALTALMYAASKADEAVLHAQLAGEFERGKKSAYDHNKHNADKYLELVKIVEAFEEASGLRIQYSSVESVQGLGKIVSAVRDGKSAIKRRMHTVEYALTSVKDMIPALEEQVEVLRKASAEAIADGTQFNEGDFD